MFYWVLKRIVLGPLLRALFRPWIIGAEHVPASGGAILASNHLSFSDSFFLPLMVERRMTFLAKSDYFTGRGVKGRLTAGFFRGAGQVPVDRSGGSASEAAIGTGLRFLRRGDLLAIYPEGTRSPDGRLYRGKTGVARMALEAKVPVLPVVMVGTAQVQPIGQRIPRIRRVGMVIGPPLDFSRYEGMEGDRFVLRSITDEIMYELMRLSGQEYVDEYAATMKERIAAAARRGRAAVATGAAEAAGAVAPGGRPAPEPVLAEDDAPAVAGGASQDVDAKGDADVDEPGDVGPAQPGAADGEVPDDAVPDGGAGRRAGEDPATEHPKA